MNSTQMNSNGIVYIVDDDAGVRKSLQMLMESASLPVRVYESGEAFLNSVNPDQPGCMILDLRMPGISGIELLQCLRKLDHEIPAIIVSGHADLPTAVQGMKLGAVDVLQKPFEPQALLAVVHEALAHSVRLQNERCEAAGFRKRLATLTPRELDLLKRVVAGLPNKRIAVEMQISIKTVANHRANLMAKTQALNAADLARRCTVAGIFSGK
jgi:two-component system, LuxR family, response regulator FixJ